VNHFGGNLMLSAADAPNPSVIVVHQGSGAYSLAPSTMQRANLANPSPNLEPLP